MINISFPTNNFSLVDLFPAKQNWACTNLRDPSLRLQPRCWLASATTTWFNLLAICKYNSGWKKEYCAF